jgi:hypothetical protein
MKSWRQVSTGAERVQQYFRKEGRIDPADFCDRLQRYEANAHEVIDYLTTVWTKCGRPQALTVYDREILEAKHEPA